MKPEIVEQAQEFLTVDYTDRISKIADLDLLIFRHGPEKVHDYLNSLLADYKKRLNRMIRKDKTDPRINDTIANMFRIKMAIRTMAEELQPKEAA
jgi:hypothetical protein